MRGYKVSILPKESSYISEKIGVIEIPVRLIDNRDDKEHEMVFYIAKNDGLYYIEDKVKKLCHELGYSSYEIGAGEVREFDAVRIFTEFMEFN